MTVTLNDIVKLVAPCTKIIVAVSGRYVGKCLVGLEDTTEAFGDYLRWEVWMIKTEEGTLVVNL